MVNLLCEEVTARNYLIYIARNRELAGKYRISERTVRNWRREGCPFAEGQRHVLKWVAKRRYAPTGMKAKFERQIRHYWLKWNLAVGRQWVAELQQLAWIIRKKGLPLTGPFQGIQPRRGKVQYYDFVTGKALENSLNYKGPANANALGT
jgi:hypothetical protein